MIINWKAILALLVSIGGLASHKEVLDLLPESWAVGITIIGIVAQGFTQTIARPEFSRKTD